MTFFSEHCSSRTQQPGKPKPPGNPPRDPNHERPPIVEEPPDPIPAPPLERDEPPLQA
jgi:hypothetical protein